eukprot:9480374-Pyramimonas_sp.AAC.1
MSTLAPKPTIPRSGINDATHHGHLRSRDGVIIIAGQFDDALGAGVGEVRTGVDAGVGVGVGAGDCVAASLFGSSGRCWRQTLHRMSRLSPKPPTPRSGINDGSQVPGRRSD